MAAAVPKSETQEPASFSESESLLSPAAPESPDAGNIEPLPLSAVPARPGPPRYDFRQSASMSAGGLRKLRLAHEEYVRALATRLSMYLRLEVGLKLSDLRTLPCAKFLEALPQPTCLTLFKAEPLRGLCALELPPRLALTLVDRLLGGPARPMNAARDLTEVETALLEQITQILVGDWCQQFKSAQELRPVFLGHENYPRYVSMAPRDALLLVASVEARVSDCVDTLHLAFPYATIEPLASRLDVAPEPPSSGATTTPAVRPQWNPALNEAPVRITAEWSGMELTVRELARLKVGDVLELDAQSSQQVQVCAGRMPKFRGRLGTRDNYWAVEITEVIKSAATPLKTT